MEEWISQREYCKRNKMNPDTVKKMIYDGKLEAITTNGGHIKIKVGGDTVSREQYEKIYGEYIKLKTILENIQSLVGGNKWEG